MTSGELLAVIDEQASAAAVHKAPAKAEPKKPEARKPEAAPASATAAPRKEEAPAQSSRRPRDDWSRRISCPRTRSRGSGRDGRISKSDVAHHLEAAPTGHGTGNGRRPDRPARPDVPVARAHRAAPGRGAVNGARS